MPPPPFLVSSLTFGGVTSQIVDKRTYVLLVNEACVLVELNAKITPELTIKSLIFKIFPGVYPRTPQRGLPVHVIHSN